MRINFAIVLALLCVFSLDTVRGNGCRSNVRQITKRRLKFTITIENDSDKDLDGYDYVKSGTYQLKPTYPIYASGSMRFETMDSDGLPIQASGEVVLYRTDGATGSVTIEYWNGIEKSSRIIVHGQIEGLLVYVHSHTDPFLDNPDAIIKVVNKAA